MTLRKSLGLMAKSENWRPGDPEVTIIVSCRRPSSLRVFLVGAISSTEATESRTTSARIGIGEAEIVAEDHVDE